MWMVIVEKDEGFSKVLKPKLNVYFIIRLSLICQISTLKRIQIIIITNGMTMKKLI